MSIHKKDFFTILSDLFHKKNTFTDQEIIKSFEYTDFKAKNTEKKQTAFMLLIETHNLINLQLTEDLLWYLLKKSDLKAKDDYKETHLIKLCFEYQIKPSKEQWDYLIQNSELNAVTEGNESALMVFLSQMSSPARLTDEQLELLFANSNMDLKNRWGHSIGDLILGNKDISTQEKFSLINKYLKYSEDKEQKKIELFEEEAKIATNLEIIQFLIKEHHCDANRLKKSKNPIIINFLKTIQDYNTINKKISEKITSQSLKNKI
jgi:hypothetical protein